MAEGGLEWRVEQACFNAWPALNQVHVGDWAVRFGGGLTRRVNSANPLHPAAGGLERDAEEILEFYRRAGLRPRFRIPALIAPENDQRLEALGLEVEAETCTLYASLPSLALAPDDAVAVLPAPSEAWLAAKRALSGLEARQAEVFARIAAQISLPVGFAAMSWDGRLSAVAYAAVQHGVACVEAVVTDERLRGRGLGRRMLGALLAWAEGQGARAAALQVDASNVAGRALYAALGFRTELYRSHYRSACETRA